jgi:hypothetical protein
LLPQALPFVHVGEHEGTWHWPPEQTCDPQSAFAPHRFPSLQRGAQAGAWQVPLHTVEPHWLPAVQGTPSGQFGAHEAHSPAVHTRVTQSALAPQRLPMAHPGAQAGAAQNPDWHTPEEQSDALMQAFPSGQFGEHAGGELPELLPEAAPDALPDALPDVDPDALPEAAPDVEPEPPPDAPTASARASLPPSPPAAPLDAVASTPDPPSSPAVVLSAAEASFPPLVPGVPSAPVGPSSPVANTTSGPKLASSPPPAPVPAAAPVEPLPVPAPLEPPLVDPEADASLPLPPPLPEPAAVPSEPVVPEPPQATARMIDTRAEPYPMRAVRAPPPTDLNMQIPRVVRGARRRGGVAYSARSSGLAVLDSSPEYLNQFDTIARNRRLPKCAAPGISLS